MTTNVPQDVIENTHKPDLIEKLSGLARSIEVCEGWRPTCIDEAIAKLRDQRAGGEAVGAAVTSPDDPGFTMACFEASDVPAGTKLYTQPQPTLDFAAGMMKAAELAEECADQQDMVAGALAAAKHIRNAIHADAEAALREVCMKTASKSYGYGWSLGMEWTKPKESDLQAIVNSVLEGKS